MGSRNRRVAAKTAASICGAALIVALLLAGALVAGPSSAGATSGPATADASSTPTSSTATSSTPTSSTPTTSTTPTPPPAPPVDTRPKAPKFVPQKGKAVYIDRKHQRIYLYVDGRQIDTFRCSTSRTLPRRGKYYYKFKRRASSSFSGSVSFYWQTVFTKGPHGHNIAFHSIPVNHRGHIIAPVGQPVSHGCVRCPYAKAKFIYFWITKKTPIIVRP